MVNIFFLNHAGFRGLPSTGYSSKLNIIVNLEQIASTDNTVNPRQEQQFQAKDKAANTEYIFSLVPSERSVLSWWPAVYG